MGWDGQQAKLYPALPWHLFRCLPLPTYLRSREASICFAGHRENAEGVYFLFIFYFFFKTFFFLFLSSASSPELAWTDEPGGKGGRATCTTHNTISRDNWLI